jgi:hypothetical protein
MTTRARWPAPLWERGEFLRSRAHAAGLTWAELLELLPIVTAKQKTRVGDLDDIEVAHLCSTLRELAAGRLHATLADGRITGLTPHVTFNPDGTIRIEPDGIVSPHHPPNQQEETP